MKTPQGERPKGIKEIADALGISIGTVDRALHNRKGVSPKTRDLILKTAEKLKYTPNIAARNLKLNRRLVIGVYLPRQIASYYNPLREGIRAAAHTETSASLDVEFHQYPSLGQGDIELMKASDWLKYDGVIIAPGHPNRMAVISEAAASKNKPIVCVTTDASRIHRLASITADSFVSGGIAAELLGSWATEPGEVAMFTGDLQVQDHADKLRGFAATLATTAPHLTLISAIESHDSFDRAYRAATKTLADHPRLRGIYVNTANSMPVLKALEEAARKHPIRLITTDLFPELVPFIESGRVSASLYQRPFTQGRLALEALCGYLAREVHPKLQTRLAPHIILRSNLSLFSETLEREPGKTGRLD